MGKYYVIGLSGVTNGGKTSLARKIKQTFPHTHLFCMDDYFWPENHENLVYVDEVGHNNWDDMTAVNFKQLKTDLHQLLEDIKKSPTNEIRLVVVEGIMVFNYKPLLPYFDKKYYFTLDKPECWQRRLTRVYTPADPPHYFDKVVWPMHLTHLREVQNQTTIEYIDGTKDQGETFDQVYEDICGLMAK